MAEEQKPRSANRGLERRRGMDRRQGSERREEIRFEPGREDRRGGKDRRKHGGWDSTASRY